jgi:8-oxo-dGTP diphosphatase
MQEYVLGFRFDREREWVVLIEKKKPARQYGFLNGVGGKIEENEEPIEAMVREFEEETGVTTSEKEWAHALTLDKEDEFKVFVFASVGDITECQTMEEEEVVIGHARDIPDQCLYNLHWMIPLILDHELALPIVIPYV